MSISPLSPESHSNRIDALLDEECARAGIPSPRDREALGVWAADNAVLWPAFLAVLAWFAESPSAAHTILGGKPWPPKILELRERIAARLRALEAEGGRSAH